MVQYLAQTALTPTIAYTVSVIGSLLGLAFATRARLTTSAARWVWLALAALSLGGTAVWSMHFIAMMGYSVPDVIIRYDPLLTVGSGVLAVAVMAVALALTITRPTNSRLITGGLISGVGIVSMHYMGMASMNVAGTMHHEHGHVVAASAIALVAATAALWFASRLRGAPVIVVASLVMAAAVTAMHYTAMAGVSITPADSGERRSTPPGSSAPDLLLPLIVGLFVFLLICSLVLMLAADDRDGRGRAARRAPSTPGGGPRGDVRTDGAPAPYTPRHSARGTAPAPADDVWTPRNRR
ncbi:MHYT domain-containing protein [Nocardiopsis sp. FIRDI 009]|uniref:MHYT domain-containing protein n=1 Tax=Nocardiopsis sp. FIRDI 009 TaxID=714197 RepID=UPI000E25CC96|nr:MHYT domain-containing protein [Nocardiopsis sp. FIRDI 009]